MWDLLYIRFWLQPIIVSFPEFANFMELLLAAIPFTDLCGFLFTFIVSMSYLDVKLNMLFDILKQSFKLKFSPNRTHLSHLYSLNSLLQSPYRYFK